jgi:hypothetical protein
MTMTTGLVLADAATQTGAAIAGFLAGYYGSTRRSYATDLRLFAAWCGEANLALFGVCRAHLELFGRWMEENGKMRSTVARRLSTLASFYRYCEDVAGRVGQCQQPIRRPTQPRNTGFDRRREPIVIGLISGANDHANYDRHRRTVIIGRYQPTAVSVSPNS